MFAFEKQRTKVNEVTTGPVIPARTRASSFIPPVSFGPQALPALRWHLDPTATTRVLHGPPQARPWLVQGAPPGPRLRSPHLPAPRCGPESDPTTSHIARLPIFCREPWVSRAGVSQMPRGPPGPAPPLPLCPWRHLPNSTCPPAAGPGVLHLRAGLLRPRPTRSSCGPNGNFLSTGRVQQGA